MEQDVVTIGKSVVIKGELSAKEDIIVEGRVEGKVELDHNVLTIGPAGRIKAQVLATRVIVMGKVRGDITATEAIQVRETATVDGELVAPKIGMARAPPSEARLTRNPPRRLRFLRSARASSRLRPASPTSVVHGASGFGG